MIGVTSIVDCDINHYFRSSKLPRTNEMETDGETVAVPSGDGGAVVRMMGPGLRCESVQESVRGAMGETGLICDTGRRCLVTNVSGQVLGRVGQLIGAWRPMLEGQM